MNDWLEYFKMEGIYQEQGKELQAALTEWKATQDRFNLNEIAGLKNRTI